MAAGISLIDTTESADGVSPEEKAAFFAGPAPASAATTQPQEEEEEGDLFDDFD